MRIAGTVDTNLTRRTYPPLAASLAAFASVASASRRSAQIAARSAHTPAGGVYSPSRTILRPFVFFYEPHRGSD